MNCILAEPVAGHIIVYFRYGFLSHGQSAPRYLNQAPMLLSSSTGGNRNLFLRFSSLARQHGRHFIAVHRWQAAYHYYMSLLSTPSPVLTRIYGVQLGQPLVQVGKRTESEH